MSPALCARFRVFATPLAFGLALGSAQAQTQVPAPSAAGSAPAPVELERVLVRASADASADGLPPPYAGGQVARGGRVGVLGSQDMMDTPFSITRYTQALIQNQQAASVADVLQNDGAVRVARGFGNYQQLYLVRGLPIYSDDMAYNGLYGLLPRQYLAAELLERVEVLRGASAFLNGAAPGGSGLGGAINVMPKRAPAEALQTLTLGTESGGSGYAAADIARRFGADGRTGVRINAVRRDGDTAVDGATRELGLFAIGIDHRGANFRVSADLGHQDHQLGAAQPSVTIAPGLPIPDAPDASRNLAQPWTDSNERDTFGTLRAELDLGPRTVAWLAVGARRGKESATFANPTVNDAAGTTTSSRFDNTREDTVATGELGLRHSLRTGPVGHTLTASAAAYRDRSKNAFAFYLTPIAGDLEEPFDVAPSTGPVFAGGRLADPRVTARTRTESLALADTLSFAQDLVLLTLGARHQEIESRSYDYATGAEAPAYSASRVSPVAGVVLKAGKAVSLYATYIEGLVRGDIAPALAAGLPVANAGEVFDPYRTRQVEVGAKLDAGRVGGTLSVFRSRKPIASFDAESGRFGITDAQRNTGVELSVFGEPLRRLKLLGGISRLHTDVDGRDGIGSPRTLANLGAEWSLPWVEGLWFDARAVYTGPQYADAANRQALPSWSRFDLGARYALDLGERRVTLRARIDNLADRDYWASAGGYPGAGYLTLGAPRTVIVSAALDF